MHDLNIILFIQYLPPSNSPWVKLSGLGVTGPGVTQTDEGRKSQVSLITSRESLAFCKQYSVTKLPGGHQMENQPDNQTLDFTGVFLRN